MLSEKQWERMVSKLIRFETALDGLIFEKTNIIPFDVKKFETTEPYYDIPDDGLFTPCAGGDVWGEEYGYCWFKCRIVIPPELDGKTIFLYPKTGAYEALLFVNGMPFGTFCSKYVVTAHGNHYCNMLVKSAKAGETIDIALECYSGHHVKGCMPFDENGLTNFKYMYESLDICVKNEKAAKFMFDLRTVTQAVKALDKNSFRRADLLNTLKKVHDSVYYDYDNVDKEIFYAGLDRAGVYLEEALACVNPQSAPYAGLIGHSHMDTAWLWHIDETIKKCARTFSNQLSLMEQYGEYTFVQSSAYHGEMMRRHYPALFEQIKKLTAAGRYEPNGGVWIECDCNITGGEALIRQFLWGQNFNKKHFGGVADSFWLPDTFGYSASIPQIMKGCLVDYFLTTKIAWNDTTEFPHDTFYWRGIDGTKVLTHFNKTHIWPDAKNLIEYTYGGNDRNGVKDKTVTDMRLLSYGFGDGGGGPQFEMIEMSRRVKDFEGVPKSGHTTVSDFMKRLEATIVNPSTYSGELYLELHRGTLTSQHTIKRNNRLAEIALHDLELVTVAEALDKNAPVSGDCIRPLTETLLVNQFHDILPGTCIPRVHEQTRKEMAGVINDAGNLIRLTAGAKNVSEVVSVVNTLSFARNDVIYLDARDGYIIEGGYEQQEFIDLHGNKKIAVSGVTIGGFSSVVFKYVRGAAESHSAFKCSGDILLTPFAKVTFDERGFISSFIDLESGRELKGEGYPLNAFLIAEDVPALWDNWDIDADIETKYKDTAVLLSREVVADGAAEYRIRSLYQISPKSVIKQDMVFFSNSREVRFETIIDWNDDHRLLKTAFDTTVLSDIARHEIQFGHVKRPTTRSTDVEKAKFEVVNHKYTDLSDFNSGVAVLNDCKYGISVCDSQIRLTLHKGGMRPDYTGDRGVHECVYAFLPHGPFSAESVIRPAYALNYRPIILDGEYRMRRIAETNADNIIIETVKPCEEIQNAFIMRLYEAEGGYTNTVLTLGRDAEKIELTNMLEETVEGLPERNNLRLTFMPFEIKTLKITY